MKYIKQFRYQKNNSEMTNVNLSDLIYQNIFAGYGNITQMGIQAPRGTTFYLNNASNYPIVIGDTGIYEIDLQDHGHIFKITFDRGSIESLVADGSTGRLLIDIIYEGSGASV